MHKKPFSRLMITTIMAVVVSLTPIVAQSVPQNPKQLFTAKPNPIYQFLEKTYRYNYGSWGALAVPRPTNAWFTNLAILPIFSCAKNLITASNSLCQNIAPMPVHPGSKGDCFDKASCPNRFMFNPTGTMNDANGVTIAPAAVMPYYVGKTSQGGLKVAYAGHYTGQSKENGGRLPGAVFAVLWDPATDIHLSAKEFFESSDKPSYFLSEYSPLSLQMQMTATPDRDPNQMVTADLVRGSAYITMTYKNLTPEIVFDGVGLVKINDLPPGTDIPKNTKFKVEDANKTTWLLYSETPIKLVWEGAGKAYALAPYTGWLRLAFLQDPSNQNDEKLLDKYSTTIPLKGDVQFDVNGNILNYKFVWTTNNGETPLIMALPHHQAIFDEGTKQALQPSIKMNSNIGELVGVTATTWGLQETLPNIQFNLLDSPAQIPAAQAEAIRSALKEDAAKINNPEFFNPDAGSYTFGKHAAKLAQLALIADFLGEQSPKEKIILTLEQALSKWVSGTNKDPLFYDTTFGGIVPEGDDFGALSVYNDHHFHYGYFVYSMAILAKLDSKWINTPINGRKPVDWVNVLIRDYANVTQDTFFPRLRMQDDYDGHSWASGMVVYGDGKNQESVSEAVNAYYAIALFGDATRDLSLSSAGRFLLARELRAAKTYWLLDDQTRGNDYAYYVVNLFNAKIDAHTFFETARYIGYTSYGIQMLPFTAITPALTEAWISKPEVMKEVIAVMDYNKDGLKTPDPWKWLLLKGVALGKSREKSSLDWWNKAVNEVKGFFDDGDTRTNTLFSISSYLNRR